MWYFFAATSAFLYAFRGILEKKIVGHTNKYILGFAIRLFALPFFLIPFIFYPELLIAPSQLTINFWLPIILICFVMTPLETIFYYEALKEEELSLALPILSLAPIITIFAAAGLFREFPSFVGFLGIILILVGIYALKINYVHEGILAPLKHLRKSRGVQLMLVVMISLGFGSILDKIALTASNAFFFAAVNYLLLCCTLFILTWFKARRHFGQLITHYRAFSVLGMFVAGYTIFYLLALQSGVTSYVLAIKNASILFTIIFSLIILKEKNRGPKLLAAALIFIGLLCIKVFG